MELEFIDYGAEEVFEEEDGIIIYGPFESFGSIQKAIEERGIEIISSGFERIPNDTKTLTEEQEADVEKLLAKFDDDDDIQNVYRYIYQKGLNNSQAMQAILAETVPSTEREEILDFIDICYQ